MVLMEMCVLISGDGFTGLMTDKFMELCGTLFKIEMGKNVSGITNPIRILYVVSFFSQKYRHDRRASLVPDTLASALNLFCVL